MSQLSDLSSTQTRLALDCLKNLLAFGLTFGIGNFAILASPPFVGAKFNAFQFHKIKLENNKLIIPERSTNR
jgi:hypothetical protein